LKNGRRREPAAVLLEFRRRALPPLIGLQDRIGRRQRMVRDLEQQPG
jgi:hypothetical protein